jgi:NADH dehydrogenase FAD-containing subunit
MSGQCKEGREQRPTVVALGGGFGGTGAVRKVADAGADVILVQHSAGVLQSCSFGVGAR